MAVLVPVPREDQLVGVCKGGAVETSGQDFQHFGMPEEPLWDEADP